EYQGCQGYQHCCAPADETLGVPILASGYHALPTLACTPKTAQMAEELLRDSSRPGGTDRQRALLTTRHPPAGWLRSRHCTLSRLGGFVPAQHASGQTALAARSGNAVAADSLVRLG